MFLPSPPVALRNLIARLPPYPPALVAAVGLNALLSQILNARNLPAARGKVVAIEIRDAGLALAFAVEDTGLVALGRVRPDATISANLRDLAALAWREEDPDTLFFSRRLTIQGDTELGLLVKNTLDAVDLRTLAPPPPSRVLDALRLQMPGWLR